METISREKFEKNYESTGYMLKDGEFTHIQTYRRRGASIAEATQKVVAHTKDTVTIQPLFL